MNRLLNIVPTISCITKRKEETFKNNTKSDPPNTVRVGFFRVLPIRMDSLVPLMHHDVIDLASLVSS